MPMHQSLLEQYPELEPIYEGIQKYNEQYPAEAAEGGTES